jgi:hypothetical protein
MDASSDSATRQWFLCASCLEPYEAWRPGGRKQRCRCAVPSEDPTWAGFDFNERLRLCDCCLQVLIRSGSRWSSFFCDRCRQRVLALNRTHGTVVVPIGRHSLMHGIGLKADRMRDPQEVNVFHARALTLFERIDRLKVWKKARLHQILSQLRLPSDQRIPLSEFLIRIRRLAHRDSSFGKLGAFRALVAHLEGEDIG